VCLCLRELRLSTPTNGMTTRGLTRSDSTLSFLQSKRPNSSSKLAHVHEQSKFAHIGSLVAAGHLSPEVTAAS